MIKAFVTVSIMMVSHGQNSPDRSFYSSITECSTITQPVVRLACYDKIAAGEIYYVPKDIKGYVAKQSKAFYGAQVLREMSDKRHQQLANTQDKYISGNDGKSGKGRLQEQAKANYKDEFGLKKPIEKKQQDKRVLKITKVKQNAYGLRYFYADNGQIWKQKYDSSAYIKKPPYDVEITQGTLGGFHLKLIGKKRTLQVVRVK